MQYAIVDNQNRVIGILVGEIPPVPHAGCRYVLTDISRADLRYALFDPETETIFIDEQAKLDLEKRRLIERLEDDTKHFIEYKANGSKRYTTEKQISFTAIVQMCQMKLSDPNITETERQDYETRLQMIQQAFDWIRSVLDYHYQIDAQINAATSLDELNSITWDYSSFETSDPDIRLAQVRL